jgi:hypothetical protein
MPSMTETDLQAFYFEPDERKNPTFERRLQSSFIHRLRELLSITIRVHICRGRGVEEDSMGLS